jgi:tetratricopeptide (TPR) repeat protein
MRQTNEHEVDGKSLDDAVYARILELAKQGDEYLENDQFRQAAQVYQEAVKLLPQPRSQWEAATWLYTALGEAFLSMEDYPAAREALTNAMHCPDAIGNPLIHLLLGEAQYELGNLNRAADELARAYLGAGDEIFEDEDPKYLAFLRAHLRPPAEI